MMATPGPGESREGRNREKLQVTVSEDEKFWCASVQWGEHRR
jgi:hypothetical protein